MCFCGRVQIMQFDEDLLPDWRSVCFFSSWCFTRMFIHVVWPDLVLKVLVKATLRMMELLYFEKTETLDKRRWTSSWVKQRKRLIFFLYWRHTFVEQDTGGPLYHEDCREWKRTNSYSSSVSSYLLPTFTIILHVYANLMSRNAFNLKVG